jgi:hypothetical protein
MVEQLGKQEANMKRAASRAFFAACFMLDYTALYSGQ